MANYQAKTVAAARRYGLDPHVFKRQIKQESGFNPGAVSPAGAIGIAQIMPATAAGWGVDPHDPDASLDAAAKNMASYIKKYGGMKNALIAYNAGPGAIGKKLPAETINYINTILGNSKGASSSGSKATGSRTVLGTKVDKGSTGSVTAAREVPDPQAAALMALSSGADPTKPLPKVGSGPLASAAYLLSSGQATKTEPTKYTNGKDASVTVTSRTVATGGGAASRIIKGIKPGVPVAHETSEGGEHETMGLPGYPAHDFMAPSGSAAVAPISGKVVRLSGHDPAAGPTNGPHGPLGFSIYIQGDDGHSYFLTHLGSRTVKVGQKLKAGQKIGTVADYAKYGTPSHIHMGVR